MRYAQGGGLGPGQRVARERIRMLAGEGFGRGVKNAVISKELRVSLRSVEGWRRAWREQGIEALRGAARRSGASPLPRDGPFYTHRNAGAGQPAAAYCLYLHHLALGEDDIAQWWHRQTEDISKVTECSWSS
ncbi:helix-turn-helix domain-containing protein [Streptomyces sp. NPDC055243]|uniref:helix-turn-helix domain-containing protein n=1 Tax=Streptomyces sp. NPDC055243 TaxID=3365720 RepID=UPI0037D5A84C